MCGRYQLEYGMNQLMLLFDADNRYLGYESKHEIFPTDMVAIIKSEGKRNYIEPAKWGFKNQFDNRPLINARGETLDEKKTFKNLFAQSRCLVPASAFFEWRKNPDGSKTKVQITITDNPVFAMAGLYKIEQDEKGDAITRCTIVTTSANIEMSKVHDRMPVLLPKELANAWLDDTIHDTMLLKDLLKSYDGALQFHTVA